MSLGSNAKFCIDTATEVGADAVFVLSVSTDVVPFVFVVIVPALAFEFVALFEHAAPTRSMAAATEIGTRIFFMVIV
jgi:hypothetical protein